MAAAQFREISAVCTHPAHVGRGYAAALISKLAREQQRDGIVSFLHVAAGNSRACALYERLGFVVRREVAIHLMRRDDS
jgi:predicted GNAT family acetyltransferase